MAHLMIRLLAPFEVSLNGEPADNFNSDKVRALLAYLCVEAEGAHRRERLAGLLWPDYPEDSARANLRNALANLRHVIGDRPKSGKRQATCGFLNITRQTIQFNAESDTWVDAWAFLAALEAPHPPLTDLEGAVALYLGEFMEGFSLSDSAIFGEWLLLQRERFGRLALEALHRLAKGYTMLGDYEAALAHAWRQVELDPMREKAHRQLMRILAYNNQDSQALVQYETCRQLLAHELDAKPSAETAELYRQIKKGSLVVPEPPIYPLPSFLREEEETEAESPVCVARDIELAQLDRYLNHALDGDGRVVFITGEPGSGKSILAEAFIRQAMDSNPDLLGVKGRCNAYTGVGDPYLPFLEILQMLTGNIEASWAGGEITGQHARRLWAQLPCAVQVLLDYGPELIDRFLPGGALLARLQAQVLDQAVRLAELLDRRASSAAEPAKLKQTDLFEQYTQVLQALSRKHPLILMMDDLQWIDTGSVSLLFHLGRRLAGSRILLVGAYRPGEIALGRPSIDSKRKRHPLGQVIHEFQRELGDIQIDLDETEGRQFIEAFLDTEPNRLSERFQEELYEHTSGHPLFTVELLRSLQDHGGLIRDASGYWITGPDLNWENLPPRVEAVIAERLSRLPEELQTMLTVASVEGESFTAEIVACVQGKEEDYVLQLLSRSLSQKHKLVQAQDSQWLGEQRLSRYRFRHFLFQKYLYDKLDPVQQAHLHQAVGTALETLHGDEAGKLAVLLARHFEEAGMTTKATKYLLIAGKRAVRLFAYQEAITHLRHGLKLVEMLPKMPQRNQLELSLLLALAIPLGAIRGQVAELEQTYRRARDLTKNIEPSEELFQALQGLVSYYTLSLELPIALKFSQDMLNIAKRLEREDLLFIAHHFESVVHFYLGRADDFLETQKQLMSLYEAERERILENQFGLMTLGETFSHGGWALWHLGYPEQAKQRLEALVALANRTNHPYFQAEAYMNAAFSFWNRRKVQEAREVAVETIAISRQHSYSFSLGAGLGIMGWALGVEGELDEGIDKILQGLAVLKDSNSWLLYQHLLVLLADTYLKAGKGAEGLAVIDESLGLINQSEFRVHEPEIYRLKGELLLLEKGLEAEAEACFERAIEIAKEQEAKSWELRAVMSLCRLWKWQGKHEQARTKLMEIFNWFTEGFEMPDLQEAKSLLDALS